MSYLFLEKIAKEHQDQVEQTSREGRYEQGCMQTLSHKHSDDIFHLSATFNNNIDEAMVFLLCSVFFLFCRLRKANTAPFFFKDSAYSEIGRLAYVFDQELE